MHEHSLSKYMDVEVCTTGYGAELLDLPDGDAMPDADAELDVELEHA